MSKINTKPTKLITENLVDEVVQHIQHSSTIYILTAFAMKSGVQMILPALQEAAYRGADIKILTGDYLYVTQPEALGLLSELPSDNTEVRLWQSHGRSFHPKAFMFNNREEGALVIGPSNLSKSALTSGVEWNVCLHNSVSNETYEEARSHFIHLFYDEMTKAINRETVKQYRDEHADFHREHPDLVHQWSK